MLQYKVELRDETGKLVCLVGLTQEQYEDLHGKLKSDSNFGVWREVYKRNDANYPELVLTSDMMREVL